MTPESSGHSGYGPMAERIAFSLASQATALDDYAQFACLGDAALELVS